MNLFEEQLRNRTHNDERKAAQELRKLSDAVNGKSRRYYPDESTSRENIRQIKMICGFLDVDVPEKIKEEADIDEQIDTILSLSGATKRRIKLSDKWWKDGDGPILARIRQTEEVTALLPGQFGGYYFTDIESGQKIRVTKKNKDLFEKEAYCFYKPLPNQSMEGRAFIGFLLKQLRGSDLLILILSTFFITLYAMITPFAMQYAFSDLIPSGKLEMLIPLAVLLVSAALGMWLMNVVKTSVSFRINSRLDVVCKNAVYSRVIRLPASFFGDKSAGGLTSWCRALNKLPWILTDILFGVFLSILMSLIYIVQIFTIAKPLALPVFLIFVLELAFFAWTVLEERKVLAKQLSGEEKNSGIVYALLSGIQKIKISGSENRAFAKWLETYSEKIGPTYAIKFPYTIRKPMITLINMAGLLWIYVIAYRNNVSIAEFVAFSSAFGMTMAGISALGSAGTSFSMIRPILEMGEPILREIPEENTGKRIPDVLNGKIDLDHVVFRYDKDSPAVINGISLHINPGEYVAVVGKSGCGKSTLLRILLGFVEPEQGTVYYDNLDLGSLDKRYLRRNIGTVLQDGKLFTGDIFSNIAISAPWATPEDVWDAAEKAGMADDIRRMPMGMNTMISEGNGGISGGQTQRLLIARAICGKPNIIMLDEATSALDNITQKIVTDSFNAMKCTRIVIAHRLSTIRQCTRIIVLDGGVIAEEGTYEELLAKGGLFTELVERQMVEETKES